MYKKNSWIVALLVALSFSALFIGCIEPLAETPPDEDTYTEFELTEFNAVGGNNLYQVGWATDGSKNEGKPVKDIGLTVEMLQKAKYLVVEVNDGYPKNNFETIYDSFNADGDKIGDWVQFSNITTASGELNPGMGTREGNILKLEMAKIIKNYAVFKDKSTVAITLLIQHWGNDGPKACIKSAKLLIPDAEEPFVALTGLTLVKSAGFVGKSFELRPVFTPENSSVQTVAWALYDDATNTAGASWDKGTSIIDDTVIPAIYGKSKNKLVANAVGTFKVKATLREAALDSAGGFVDFTKDFTITITDPEPFVFKVGGVDQSTQEWGGEANGGETTDMTVSPGGKYTLDFSAGYGNCYYYFAVDFGSETLADYTGVSFKYTGISGDFQNKDFRAKAALEPPPSAYNPGLDISRTTGYATVSGDTVELKFGYTDDTATETFAANVTTLSEQNIIYIWFIPWSEGVKFEISDVSFYKTPLKIKVDGVEQSTGSYGAFDNSGGSGSTMIVAADGLSFTATYTGNNGNSYSFFKVDFGSDKFVDYKGVKFKLTGVDEDGVSSYTGGVSARIKVSPTMPSAGQYAPGHFVWLGPSPDGNVGDISSAKEFDATFGADERGSGNAVNWDDADKNSSVVYFWIYYQPNLKAITFTVSDIEFYKP